MKLTSEDLILAAETLHLTRERFTRVELGEQLLAMGKDVPSTTLKVALRRAVNEQWFEVVGVAETSGQPWLYRLTDPEENAQQVVDIAAKLGGTLSDGRIYLDVPAAMRLAARLNIWP